MIIVTQAQLRNKDTEAMVPDFKDVVECTVYAPKEYNKGYIIPYNFPLNTRRGFRTIYYLMKLSNHDMTTVIKDIIAVRHAGINFIRNVCDNLEKENDCMLTSTGRLE